MKKPVPQSHASNPDRIVPPEEGPERFRKMRKDIKWISQQDQFLRIVSSTANPEKN